MRKLVFSLLLVLSLFVFLGCHAKSARPAAHSSRRLAASMRQGDVCTEAEMELLGVMRGVRTGEMFNRQRIQDFLAEAKAIEVGARGEACLNVLSYAREVMTRLKAGASGKGFQLDRAEEQQLRTLSQRDLSTCQRPAGSSCIE